jgi:hypothetical protein
MDVVLSKKDDAMDDKIVQIIATNITVQKLRDLKRNVPKTNALMDNAFTLIKDAMVSTIAQEAKMKLDVHVAMMNSVAMMEHVCQEVPNVIDEAIVEMDLMRLIVRAVVRVNFNVRPVNASAIAVNVIVMSIVAMEVMKIIVHQEAKLHQDPKKSN